MHDVSNNIVSSQRIAIKRANKTIKAQINQIFTDFSAEFGLTMTQMQTIYDAAYILAEEHQEAANGLPYETAVMLYVSHAVGVSTTALEHIAQPYFTQLHDLGYQMAANLQAIQTGGE